MLTFLQHTKNRCNRCKYSLHI